jgi:DNA-binding response OmpR family regulator
MDSVKVLCVENHAEYLEALKYLLEAAGYEVLSAANGSEGVSMLERYPVEGVLLEYDPPDASGATVREKMKRIKPEIPVLLFAGIGSQTPFLIRFLDSYLRNAADPRLAFRDFDS